MRVDDVTHFPSELSVLGDGRPERLPARRRSRGHLEPRGQSVHAADGVPVDSHTDVSDLVAVVGNL